MLFCLACGSVQMAGAEAPLEATDNAGEESEVSVAPGGAAQPVPILPPLLVTGSLLDQSLAAATLDREQIEALPARNGTLSDVLPLLPGIQTSDLRSPSYRGGEITAPELSISGASFYQNTYRIDGVAIDSKLDPVADDPNDTSNIPGHSTGISPSQRLVEKVVVYDHSVPARYGNFTGGVVDVTTRSPGETPGGAFHLRGTKDSWSTMHVAAEEKDAFYDSGSHLQQPDFVKYDAGAELELPLAGESGMLLMAQTVRSRIGLSYLDTKKNQSRRTDLYALKWRGQVTSRDDLALSFNAMPTRNEFFIENTKDSDFTLGGNSYLYSFNWIRTTPFASVTTSAGLAISHDFRDAPEEWRNWKITPSKSWGTLAGTSGSREGGFGSLTKQEKNQQLANHWEFQPISSGPLHHRGNAGFELSRSTATFERPVTAYSYTTAVLSGSVVCSGDSENCVDAEQYFTRRSVYPAGRSEARILQESLYLEDVIAWGPVELRPGARFSTDDYTHNRNLAPRFAAVWDLFGGRQTLLLGGLNRYYGQVLLTDQLRTMQKPTVYEKRSLLGTSPGPWEFSTQSILINSTAALDTPYTDEVSAGIDQELLGGRLLFDYIHRKGCDEIASERSDIQADGKRYVTFNNNGRSRYEAYRLSWQRNWKRGQLLVNVTRADNTTNIVSYNTLLDDVALDKSIWYEGAAISRDELPRSDFNRAWTGNLTWLQRLPLGFEFTNVTRYRSGYHAIEDTGLNMTDPKTGEIYDIYDDVRRPSSWIFDWLLAWRSPRVAGIETRLVVEVLNVFDSKVHMGGYYDNRYEMGRQFWAGIEGQF